jgi:hypothetical protein
MTIRLNGSTSGYTEIDAPAVAGSNTLVLPTGNGVAGQLLQTNGSGALSWAGSLTLGTAQNTTSGTTIDFTGIPSWAKRVTVSLAGVSLSGSDYLIIRLGTSSGFETSGYIGLSTYTTSGGGVSGVGILSGFPIFAGSPAQTVNGAMVFTLVSGNTWVASSVFGVDQSPTAVVAYGGGSKTLGGVLDRVRLVGSSTDTFDAGLANILYEG